MTKDVIVKLSTADYPELAALMSGWFHQDFDIEGDTIESIISAFSASARPEDIQLLISDISSFLEIDNDHIDDEFIRIFSPDVEPTGFAPTTRAFLEEILLHLSKSNRR